MAWRNTGKTRSILPKLREQVIMSDDYAILDDRGYLHPYPRPIRAYSYNRAQLPATAEEKLRFKLKASVTPPWKPVSYLTYTPPCSASVRIGRFDFLNAPDETHAPSTFARVAEYVMAFELAYFHETYQLLGLAEILGPTSSVFEIVSTGLAAAVSTTEAR
jgi:hypothetical protein